MARTLNAKLDALFVEGPDDGAVVNALVKKLLGLDLSRRPYLVRTNEDGGGASWALSAFDAYVKEAPAGSRIGVIVDRDGTVGRPDNWPGIHARLQKLGSDVRGPDQNGAIVEGRVGIWMWPDNVSVGGDLESFVSGIIPPAPLLAHATEASRIAKESFEAEYDPAHAAKAALKVRSVWRDASAAGGYGHLVRNLHLTEPPNVKAFLAWFTTLFLT